MATFQVGEYGQTMNREDAIVVVHVFADSEVIASVIAIAIW